jgi:hypothetical protein
VRRFTFALGIAAEILLQQLLSKSLPAGRQVEAISRTRSLAGHAPNILFKPRSNIYILPIETLLFPEFTFLKNLHDRVIWMMMFTLTTLGSFAQPENRWQQAIKVNMNMDAARNQFKSKQTLEYSNNR